MSKKERIFLVNGAEHPTLIARVDPHPGTKSVLITLEDTAGTLFPGNVVISLSSRRTTLWDTLLLDYGVDTAETMLREFNYSLCQTTVDGRTTYELLEISNEPFIHTQRSINAIHKIFGEYAKRNEQPYEIDRRTVVLRNFPIKYTHHGREVEMFADVRGTWSAFSPDITLQGALKNTIDRRGIRLIKNGAAMYLPVINKWEENLTVGANLLADKYSGLIRSAMERAAREHATLADCDRIRRVCAKLPELMDKRGLRLADEIHQHLRAGFALFDYRTHLDEVYDIAKLDALSDDEGAATIKYFAPAHVCRADIIRFIVELSDMDRIGVLGRRFLNDLLFDQRHTSLQRTQTGVTWHTT